MLIEGTDFLYYRSAITPAAAVTGMKNAEVAVIATRRVMFLVPIQETSLGLGWITVKRHLVSATATTSSRCPRASRRCSPIRRSRFELLEERLRAIVPTGEGVVELDELASPARVVEVSPSGPLPPAQSQADPGARAARQGQPRAVPQLLRGRPTVAGSSARRDRSACRLHNRPTATAGSNAFVPSGSPAIALHWRSSVWSVV